MNTVNIVLLTILATMIDFAMGNVFGQTKMKMLFNDLLTKMTEGLKSAASSLTKKEDSDDD